MSPNSTLLTPHSLLITGGCGFIGSALIARLLRSDPNLSIRVLDNLSVGSREVLKAVWEFQEIKGTKAGFSQKRRGGCELLVGDIQDPEICLQAARDMDCIVHLAANTGVGPSVENPRGDMEANVIGTFNLLEAARLQGAQKFIFASSGAPAGEVEPPIHEELAPHPVSPYGASKLAGEGYCSAYYRTFGLQTIALRFGNVYGPGSTHKSSVVAKFIKKALAGETCEIYGDGTQTRDFIYIEDLLEAIVIAARSNIGGEIFQIASSQEHTVKEVAHQLQNIFKSYTQTMHIRHTQARLGDVQRNFSDTTKSRTILGWTPNESLQSGLQKTVLFFLDRHDRLFRQRKPEA